MVFSCHLWQLGYGTHPLNLNKKILLLIKHSPNKLVTLIHLYNALMKQTWREVFCRALMGDNLEAGLWDEEKQCQSRELCNNSKCEAKHSIINLAQTRNICSLYAETDFTKPDWYSSSQKFNATTSPTEYLCPSNSSSEPWVNKSYVLKFSCSLTAFLSK